MPPRTGRRPTNLLGGRSAGRPGRRAASRAQPTATRAGSPLSLDGATASRARPTEVRAKNLRLGPTRRRHGRAGRWCGRAGKVMGAAGGFARAVARVAVRAAASRAARRSRARDGTSAVIAQSMARSSPPAPMAAEAANQKEVLIKHGLVETVLDSLNEVLDQFDVAVEHGSAGRQAHVGASAQLSAVADEVVQIVSVMDGLNRYRFLKDLELLSAWESASNVVATPKAAKGDPQTPGGASGEVRPAA